MNGYAFELLNVRFGIPYLFRHLTLMTCPYYAIDFFDVIVPIIYFVDLRQNVLLTKMSSSTCMSFITCYHSPSFNTINPFMKINVSPCQ